MGFSIAQSYIGTSAQMANDVVTAAKQTENWTLISDNIFAGAAASVTFDNIASGYKQFMVIASILKDGSSAAFQMTFNNTANVYYYQFNRGIHAALDGDEGLAAAAAYVGQLQLNSNGEAIFYIDNQSAKVKTFTGFAGCGSSSSGSNCAVAFGGYANITGAEISRIDFSASAGNMNAGSRFRVYGSKG